MNYQFKYKEMAQALYEALKEDTFYITLEKSINDRENAKHKMLKYFDYSIDESQRYGEILIPQETAFGVSVWTKPLDKELEVKRFEEKIAFMREELGENCLTVYKKIVAFMSEKADAIICSSAWYLSIVGVLPSYQGQGNGPKLISPVLSETDRQNIPTYLETFTPRTKKFYSQLGYEEVAVFFEPTTQAEYSIMMREVNKT